MLTLTVNGREVEVPEGSFVLDAINDSGTYISQLCKDTRMNPLGACRTCLVQIDGQRGFPASCSTPAAEGMVVETESPAARRVRKGVLELTLSMLPEAADGKDYRDLTFACEYHGVAGPLPQPRLRGAADESSPFFTISMSDCILCGRCTSGCQHDLQFIGAIDVLGAGTGARIGTFMDKPLTESICTSCGTCLSACPTGAIELKAPEVSSAKDRPQAARPDAAARAPVGRRGREIAGSVTSTCPYCGVGCGVRLQVDDRGEIAEVLDDPTNKSSVGMLCVKGRFGQSYVHHPDRLTAPLIKEDGRFREASWDEALDLVADKLVQYRGSFATLCSAKATNEDGYVQQKFARLLMQTNNIDHCTRLCHAPSVEAMLMALGSGATSNSYSDYEDAGCLVIAGSDATSNHPVAASRMRRAVVERGAKLIIINPKRIEMCDYADVWLRPHPGTDVALLNGMAKVILDEGLADEAFIEGRTEGFEEWREIVDGYPLDVVERVTGCSSEDVRQAARMYAAPLFGGSCLIWGMGMTQHTNGTASCHSLLNLAFVAGQLGRPASGISPLRGQNNVQGCGDSGCLPNSLPGYQGLAEQAVEKFMQAWGAPIPQEAGLVVTEMTDAAMDGRLKCMYITGENPLLSDPDLQNAEKAIRNLEFLVVQDLFMHETAEIADVVLPATTYAEKDGTFTNSERRVQRVRRAVAPVGRSRPDWEIVCDLARRVSQRLGAGLEEQFSFGHPSDIFGEMASLTPLLAGISYDRLDSEGGLQWPCPEPGHPGTPYLYSETFPRGPLARFLGFEQAEPAAELPDRRFPLVLNTGRILYHWHGGTMTRRSAGLLARAPELTVAVHPEDAERSAIRDGEWIRVRSRRGELEARAVVGEMVKPGEIFVPFVKLAKHAANFLTNAALDPNSKIPEYKVCAARLEKTEEDPELPAGDGAQAWRRDPGRRGERRRA